ncbi:MbeB family mobilization protein (plasmid) [Avibacterium paragallinarum]|uniref:MbeB family mobilization protein n=1 Tax=Avibacterium paragallinarum TaxID=728 RepID=UPI0021E230A7|nr:MbeB family mobilization protein [Avibacterium paragallinarum]UXN35803.1 MbeB family mobilization protein [Avibacterium paragallinarum]
MSKILDLAQNFQAQSKKELENTNEIVQNAIKQHEQDLKQQLQNASNNLSELIQIEQAKLIKSTVRMYRLPTIIALITITAGILTWQAKNAYQEMLDWTHSAEIAKEQSGGIKLSTCQTDKGIKPCIAVDKDLMGKTWGENMKIIEVHEMKKGKK